MSTTGNTGTFTVTGTTAIDGRSTNAIFIGASGNASFGVTNITNRTGIGIELSANTGTISFGNTTINNPTSAAAFGIQAQNSQTGSSITFAQLDMDGGNANAPLLLLQNNIGSVTVNGSGTISNSAAQEVLVSGGTGTVSVASAIGNTSGLAIQVSGRTAGNVTFSGNINSNSTAGAISVSTVTGGTLTFSGASKSLTSTSTDAVSLINNTGGTINFTGGGLVISTTSGIGLTATGGGTIGVTGTGNTIATTTGTALNLNGIAVGTNGIVFQSVSSNGAVNGIALTSLTGGGVVGVQVTGTGVTAGSGGTIQNTTNAAVSLTTLGSLGGGVTLNNMNITGGGGIVGSTFGTLAVTNVSLSATGRGPEPCHRSRHRRQHLQRAVLRGGQLRRRAQCRDRQLLRQHRHHYQRDHRELVRGRWHRQLDLLWQHHPGEQRTPAERHQRPHRHPEL